jgi:hypothetical protein
MVVWDRHRRVVQQHSNGHEQLNLRIMLAITGYASEEALLAKFDEKLPVTGTHIEVYRLRKPLEFDFKSDRTDVLLLGDVRRNRLSGRLEQQYYQAEREEPAPSSKRRRSGAQAGTGAAAADADDGGFVAMDYSLRQYCAVLYLNHYQKILLRGKSIAVYSIVEHLHSPMEFWYQPPHRERIRIVFGIMFDDKGNRRKPSPVYGTMMYHKNRLIKPYVKLGIHRSQEAVALGVVGVVEANFLEVTHNKQDFVCTSDFQNLCKAIADRLYAYCGEQCRGDVAAKYQALLDGIEESGALWVQCDSCLKWRMMPSGCAQADLGGEDLPWHCYQNLDKKYASCEAPQQDTYEVVNPKESEPRSCTGKRKPKPKKKKPAAAATATTSGADSAPPERRKRARSPESEEVDEDVIDDEARAVSLHACASTRAHAHTRAHTGEPCAHAPPSRAILA